MAGKSNRKSWLDDLLGEEDDDQPATPSKVASEEPSESIDTSRGTIAGRRASGKSVRFKDSVSDETSEAATAVSASTWLPPSTNSSSTLASPVAATPPSTSLSQVTDCHSVQRSLVTASPFQVPPKQMTVKSDDDEAKLIRETYE